jgi:aryl-alcohol dehydrogenase-like predicted oxidoreductase
MSLPSRYSSTYSIMAQIRRKRDSGSRRKRSYRVEVRWQGARDGDKILGSAANRGSACISCSSLGCGLLTGQIKTFDVAPHDYRRHSPNFQGRIFGASRRRPHRGDRRGEFWIKASAGLANEAGAAVSDEGVRVELDPGCPGLPASPSVVLGRSKLFKA